MNMQPQADFQQAAVSCCFCYCLLVFCFCFILCVCVCYFVCKCFWTNFNVHTGILGVFRHAPPLTRRHANDLSSRGVLDALAASWEHEDTHGGLAGSGLVVRTFPLERKVRRGHCIFWVFFVYSVFIFSRVFSRDTMLDSVKEYFPVSWVLLSPGLQHGCRMCSANTSCPMRSPGSRA